MKIKKLPDDYECADEDDNKDENFVLRQLNPHPLLPPGHR